MWHEEASSTTLDPRDSAAALHESTGSPCCDLSEIATGHVAKAARLLNLPEEIALILGQPQNEITVNFPVKMDSGSYRVFKGYRVQHNDIMGPYKGGLRYCQNLTIDECKGLALAMTWKSALQNIPFGGGMGGINFDPTRHSKTELERITRRFCHALANSVGPEYDIPAPDLGTNGQIMAWFMDTYMNSVDALDKNAVRQIVTGKSLESGGSPGREAATGQGAVHCIVEWARETRFDLTGKTVAIQGFGNVGSYTGKILSKLGMAVVAIGDHRGYIHNPEGLNPHKVAEHVKMTGSVVGYKHARPISRDAFFAIDCDILVPAARELQIGPAEARLIQARVIAEGANGPTYPEADAIFAERGITVLPDILVNSGGVTVSYYEWLQNKRAERWDEDEVLSRLASAMRRTYAEVRAFSSDRKIDLRTAAYALGLLRIQTAYADRGIWP